VGGDLNFPSRWYGDFSTQRRCHRRVKSRIATAEHEFRVLAQIVDQTFSELERGEASAKPLEMVGSAGRAGESE
jgi:hypothetical protein